MVLTEVHSTTDPSATRQYRSCEPLKDHPTLFREFAAIPWGDVAAITSFAGKYGMLDSQPMMGTHAFPLPDGVHIRGRQNYVPCDPEEDWTEGPAMFRALIRAWESSENELGKSFRWEAVGGGGNWSFQFDPSDGPTKTREGQHGLLQRIVYRHWETPETSVDSAATAPPLAPIPEASRRWYGPGVDSLSDVASAFIRQEIAKGLYGVKYRMQFVQGAEGNDLFQIIPSSLLGALYLQFGRAVAGDKEHRQCRQCGKWFELRTSDKGRKEFCTDSCKVRESRERKKQAVGLREAGQTPKQIAEAIDTPIGTVERWVNGIKPVKQKGGK
jgi:hypothetical protein